MQRVTRYPLLINQVHHPALLFSSLRASAESRRPLRLQILRYTEPDHPDHQNLSRALELAEAALNDINEAVRAHENQEKLAWLSDNIEFPGIPGGVRSLPSCPDAGSPAQTSDITPAWPQHLDLSAPTRLLGPRRIIREGKVEKAKSRRRLDLHLFNDLLIFSESRPGGGEVVYRYVRSWFLTGP